MVRAGLVVTGFGGSGSTKLCEGLCPVFGLKRHYYAGGIVRWLTVRIENEGEEKIRRMSIDELLDAFERAEIEFQPRISEAYKKFPHDLDQKVDEIQRKLLEEKRFGIHEGRMAPHVVRQLQREGKALDKIFVKILCEVDPDVGAVRMLNRAENKDKTKEQVKVETAERLLWERERYRELYGVEDHLARNHFDIVIDTTTLSVAETLYTAVAGIENLHPGLLAVFMVETK